SNLLAWLGPVLGPLATLGLAAVLAVFMLFKKEDLRNRFLRLVADGHTAAATKAVDDAAERISRYMLTQLLINTAYGCLWGIGLALIGVHHWLLWGFLAGALRYVPYIGEPAAALLPLGLSVVQFEGWLEPMLTLGWLLTLELVTANVAEPM